MKGLLQDLRYALRALRANPGFAITAIVCLALGIGANTAIFGVVNAVLLRPLPFHEPENLVQVWHVPPAQLFQGMTEFAVSPANYLDWYKQNHVFEKMAIYAPRDLTLTGRGEAQSVTAAAVSPDFFSVLHAQPALGRSFIPGEEDQPGRSSVVILSHSFWQNHFASDSRAVGQKITLEGHDYAVVGVMPASFHLPSEAEFWVPLAWTDQERSVRGNHNYSVIARLNRSVDLKQAQAEMNTISSQLELQYPEDDKGWGAVVVPLREELVGDVRPALLVLLGAVAFVLLIACANVANLVLVRTWARRKEIAIRTALGASRGRVIRQVLSETVLLALAGAVFGLLFARFGISLIVAFLGDRFPRSTETRLDLTVLGYTVMISLLTGILAGIVPALRLTKTNVNEAIKQGLGRTDGDSGGNRTREALVVSEVALSLLLLIGAGLMLRSLWNLRGVDPGLDARNVLTMSVSVQGAKYTSVRQITDFYGRLLDRVRRLPGVESAGAIDNLPLTGSGSNQPIAIEGRPTVPMSEQPEVAVRYITPGYVRGMRIPLLQGRDITEADTQYLPPAILISESLAKRYWPNENPVGKHLALTFLSGKQREVAGVVGDVKQRGLKVAEPVATLYVPLTQVFGTANEPVPSLTMSLVARAHSEPARLAPSIVNVIHELDPELPVKNVITMEDFIDDSLTDSRFNMLLLAAFAGLALLLAAVGTYSVLSYSVRGRMQEISIRMALGAQRGDVLRLILGQGVRFALLGAGIGLVAAFLLTRLLTSQLFGVKATDPATFMGVTALIIFVATAACYVPARRATRVDPLVALRYE
jgi:putative ABC transport system permease protein